ALTRPRRGVDRLDRPLHGVLRTRRDRGGAAVAPCGVPSPRHRLARAPPPSPRGNPQHHPPICPPRPPSSPPPPPTPPRVAPPGRTFFSLVVFFRQVALVAEDLSPRLRELVSTRVLDRARVLGAALRVAYLVSASTTGVLPKTPMVVERGRLLLRFDNGFKA